MKKSKEQIMSEQQKKNKARGFGRFLFLLFLLALSGFLFYRGWLQMDIPPHSRVILFTRTGGFDNVVYRPGQFVWRWEKLLPGNMSLLVFPDQSSTLSVDGNGFLPSGEVYGYWMGNPALFKYSYRVKLQMKIGDESLLDAVIHRNLTPDGYDLLLKETETVIVSVMNEALESSLDPDLQAFSTGTVLDNLVRKNPGSEISNLVIESLVLPDPLLYQKAREGYMAEMSSRQTIGLESVARRTPIEKDYESRLMILEKYGELLTRYPILIDFFKATAGNEDLTVTP
jgi:hypothetical protein